MFYFYLLINVIVFVLAIRAMKKYEEQARNIPTGDLEYYRMKTPFESPFIAVVFFPAYMMVLAWTHAVSDINTKIW